MGSTAAGIIFSFYMQNRTELRGITSRASFTTSTLATVLRQVGMSANRIQENSNWIRMDVIASKLNQ